MTEKQIHKELVAHYKKGTSDCSGDGMTVMEGNLVNNTYYTDVRCGVPGNAYATQRLYEVKVNALTGDVEQTRVLTDNKVTIFNLFTD